MLLFRHKKKTAALCAIALIATTLSTGCSSNPSPLSESLPQESSKRLEETTQETTQSLEKADLELTVDNDGGSFSNQDLIYFIMTDRFLDSDPKAALPDEDKTNPKAYHGGDFKGITASLDYIKSLGTTAIWLTPVAQNGPMGYHGYWIHNFDQIDPHLGTMADLKELVDQAHARQMKVILDYVVNHTGYDAPWLTDPAYESWFHPKKNIVDWKDKKEVEQGWLYGLPDLDTDNEAVRQYFNNNALWLIENTGVDGFRLDTVRHVSKDFWVQFSSTIKEKHPDFYLLGEVWSEHTSVLEAYHQSGIDGMTNYPLYNALIQALKVDGNVEDLAKAIVKDQTTHRPDINGLFLDNHDNPRLVTLDPVNGRAFLYLGLVFLYSYPAIPLLYYGTEVAMPGGKDPDNRKDMDWQATKEQSETLDLTRALALVRTKFAGTLTWLFNDKKTMAYAISQRDKADHGLLIMINTDTIDHQLSIDLKDKLDLSAKTTYLPLSEDTQLKQNLSDPQIKALDQGNKAQVIDGQLEVVLKPLSFALLSYSK